MSNKIWSLYRDDKFLKPLEFSNGKNQETIVEEVLTAIENEKKIIFIHGVCGTGKSAIALNIAKELGKTSIVVPGKSLQAQYKKDYEKTQYLKKGDGSKLNIKLMTGRRNHECKFLIENNHTPIKREVDSMLNDIFETESDEPLIQDTTADNPMAPCKIELKEKNFWKIKGYIKQNPHTDPTKFNEIADVTRGSVAGVCPYWSPVLPQKYDLKNFAKSKRKTYEGLCGNTFTVYEGKSGCPFYEQFNAFVDSDVIVFNSLKYKLESALNRKPKTQVEIIDECDDFLDGFSNQHTLNLDRLQFALINLITSDEALVKVIDEIQEIINHIRKDNRINDSAFSKDILALRQTGVFDILNIVRKNPELLMDADSQNYIFTADEIARSFEEFMDDTYITVSKRDNNLLVHLVTTNLAKRLQEMVDKNKVLVFMSGTLHSGNVLKNIFGIDSYDIVDAETTQQGSITPVRTGREFDCKYSNFSSGVHSRDDYILALEKCVKTAKKPCVIHVNAFNDLPTEDEIKRLRLRNLISKNDLFELQKDDKDGKIVDDFKAGEIDTLFSTKVSRGVDFPGEECNSIVFTKYPNPNVQDAFWKILMKTKPQHYWDFYRDKARRELLQKVYRGLRFKTDRVDVLSPDSRVLEFFER